MRTGSISLKSFLILIISFLLFNNIYSQQSRTIQQESLDKALNENGSLKAGVSGSFDVSGYEMSYGEKGEPVFSKPGSVNKTNTGVTWSSLGTGANGVSGSVYAFAVNSITGDVYVGGDFTAAGDIAANYIAKWNNATGWSALGSGVGGTVRAIAVSGSDVYAGGNFFSAGGQSVYNIAKWNGTSWSGLGDGLYEGMVYAIAVSGEDVYVGGTFTCFSDYSSAFRIAKWNSTSGWSAVGGGVGGPVYAIVCSGTNVFAAGQFSSAGGVTANNIARWNGTAWSALGLGVNGIVYSLVSTGTNSVIAGGAFSTAGSTSASNIARWNGASWAALGSGVAASVSALLKNGTDIYAGGSFTTPGNRIAKWNGSSWSAISSGLGGTVNAIALIGTDIYAGGSFTLLGTGTLANRIAKWNGSGWSAFSGGGVNGVSYRVNTMIVRGNYVYVGGEFTALGDGTPANRIARWNSSSGWAALGIGLGGTVNAIAVAENGDVYAAGSFSTLGDGAAANKIAKWNSATGWSALGSGLGGNVSAVAINGSEVFVGGSFTTAGGLPANYIAKWDGNSWSSLGAGLGSSVYALAVSGADLYAGGYFTSLGDGTPANRIARWNSTTGWSALGSGLGSSVVTLAINGTDLYAGGYFSTLGDGTPAKYIAKWNGSSWSAISNVGINGNIQAMAISGTDLYVGGYFNSLSDGTIANNIAKWTGTAWQSINEGESKGTNSTVMTLAVNPAENKMYVGGYFLSAGGKGVYYTASFTDPTNPLPVELVSFNASVKGKEVVLNWRTASEVNNYGFEIERKKEYAWEKIGFVAGHGNMNCPAEYCYTDNITETSGRYYYRLKQIDNDGKYKYSETVEADFNKIAFALHQNYPNPFNPVTRISWQTEENSLVTIKIYNTLGEEVMTLVDEFKETGTYITELNASALPGGIYYCSLKAGERSAVRKMVYLK